MIKRLEREQAELGALVQAESDPDPFALHLELASMLGEMARLGHSDSDVEDELMERFK